MERYLKVAGPVGVGALLLSLLIGVISGVSFGALIVRAVVFGVSFGGFALLIMVVSAQLLVDPVHDAPSTTQQEDANAEDSSVGMRLNIVVEDDEDNDVEPRAATDAPSAGGEALAADDGVTVATGDAFATDASAEDYADAVSEAAPAMDDDEEGGSGIPPARAVPASRGVTQSDAAAEESDSDEDRPDSYGDLVEEVQEQVADDETAVMNDAIAEEQGADAMEVDDSMLDELPDIGAFAGAFSAGGEGDGEEQSGYNDDQRETGGIGASRKSSGSPANDPKQIARALQTMLNRD